MGPIGKKLWNSWKTLGGVVFDWPFIVLFSCTVGLIFYAPNIKDGTTAAIIQTIFAVVTGFLGAVIYKKILESQDKGILVARGETAIRNLVLLQQNVIGMSSRVAQYLRGMPEEGSPNREATQLQFEEVIEKCAVISDEAANAIESWADLIPGADLTKRNKLVGGLNSRVHELENELEALQTKRNTEKDLAVQEKERLVKKISDTAKELRDQKKNLRKTLATYMGTAASTATASPSTVLVEGSDGNIRSLRTTFRDIGLGASNHRLGGALSNLDLGAGSLGRRSVLADYNHVGLAGSQSGSGNRRSAPKKKDTGEED